MKPPTPSRRRTSPFALGTLLFCMVTGTRLLSAQPTYFELVPRSEDPLPEAISVPFDGDPTPVFVDFDGDGDLDLFGTEGIPGPAIRNEVLLFFERTESGFERFVRLDTVDSKPTLIDVDMDGDLDIVGSHSFDANGLYFEQTQPGRFEVRAGADNPFSTWAIPYRATATPFDVNGDGLLDLVVMGVDVASWPLQQAVHYAERLPDGRFELHPPEENPFADITCKTVCTRLAFGDVDGDGDYDVVVGYNDSDHNQKRGGLQYFEQTEHAHFEERVDSANPFSSFQFNEQVEPALADLDDDGDLDVVVGLWFHYVLLDNQSGEFIRRDDPYSLFEGISFRNGEGNPVSHTFGDIDGDGDRDLVVSHGSGGFSVFERTSSKVSQFNRLVAADNPLRGIGANEAVPALVDLDGDGDTDLVFGWSGGSLFYYEQVDVARFEDRSGLQNPFNDFDVGRDSAPAFGDVDGDGDVDMVAGNRDGRFFFFERVASGSFEQKTGADNPFDSLETRWCGATTGANVPTLVDLDKDGDLDLVSGRCFFLNDANGFRPLFSSNPFLSLPQRGFRVVALDDLDDDGDRDLVDLQLGSADGFRTYMNTGRVFTSVNEKPGVRSPGNGSISVSGPMPNPVSASASVILSSNKGEVVQVYLFDAMGREIQLIHDGYLAEGHRKELVIRVDALATGLYFIQIRGADLNVVHSLTVIH